MTTCWPRPNSEAARSSRTLTAVMEDALRAAFGRPADVPRKRVDLPTFKGNGTLPGVDLDSTAAVLDLMDDAAP